MVSAPHPLRSRWRVCGAEAPLAGQPEPRRSLSMGQVVTLVSWAAPSPEVETRLYPCGIEFNNSCDPPPPL
ncbi:hypothetical protein NDU88_003446 [Pleurodeles waltl]|uniref:Uncharacterized protein n=1 Tax=Pleurodeles waltl TaxID=8319 RepID=A0AAV7Q9P0_PLEWA|nr:hypothetical protein NDU88_003446 [Pleurodeles waltl]